ncbi:DNA-directed RNA polymerase III subunit 1 isoform X2 [Beta vulgaris subsp. vulgaris]|uniref:DNA-directed RNA polymerase III subunit 1 isoform X2 n=1 Tax=Beta vulgaris subsp. vulgaris TaxID=3555 RepID=UPI0020371D91|nr:DNA-directed RNA polymerase III subunit 1 isoform X2 [Beta vulgaris subsp. vulgaris]
MNPLSKIKFTKQPYIEEDDTRQIESIDFSMFSASEMSKIAEVEVFRGVYYDRNKKPENNGLLDPKMGPPNKSAGLCATCHAKFEDCPGHYGYLPLALPVFNIGYINAIRDILKCICKSCSRILLSEEVCREYLKTMRKLDRLHKIDLTKKIMKMFANKKEILCFRCGYVNGKVKKGGSQLAIVHTLPNQVCLYLQDCELLYLADRPEKLIFTNMLVPPMALRPSVFMDGGTQSNENDITERLKRIIQANSCLRHKMEESCNSLRFLDDWNYLQVEVTQYINSEVRVASQGPQPTKPLAGFVQRLKGKHGRFRGHLSGKRVEFTGRTVISPDPNLKITEVAVPLLMATVLTYPEHVNHQNIEKLKQYVQNGSKKYPGAKFVVESNGDRRDLSFGNRKTIADGLKFGSIVHRYLEDGDVLLFNRQPSLHRMSMMCHKARIMPWRTLRFNESVCNPYNADFDGDEMNIHVPQTEEARAEALMLMGVQNNLCTPKNGTLLVASTQDFLTSSFLITRKDTFYDRAAFSLMCCYMGDGMDAIDLPTPALIKPIELWTGKQLFNVLVRPNAEIRVFVNLIVKEKIYTKLENRKLACREETMCPNDGFVYIRNSELISGQLGKATLGNGNKVGLFSVLVRDYNAQAAAACMNRLAKFSARWIGNHGFSIGIDDVQPGKLLSEQKTEKILIGYKECDTLIQSYNEGKLTLRSGCDASKTLEAEITTNLNRIREEAGEVCMQQLHWRNSPLVMSQCGSKGSPINISQMVACVGQQAVGGCRAPDGFINRSLPHFPINSKTPTAKGFVANSFYTGLTATEFFFHTMGGREGLVDTAVKTAATGYMSRRLIKCLEDLSVQYDMTVRNSSGCIIQFLYGDDAMDPTQMEGAKGFPLDFERLHLKVEATCPAGRTEKLSPSEISEFINSRLSKDEVTSCNFGYEAFKKKLLEFFGKRRCHVSIKQLQVFLDACISRLHSKGIEPGTGIGAIGAQSIGEPGTQMTLKTFHFAGVASMNVTLGVPRINEIINASKKISFPIIMTELEDDLSMEIAQTVKGQIEKTVLGQVAKCIQLIIESVKASIVVKLDMEKIKSSRLFINAHIVKEKILKSLRMQKNNKLIVIVVNDSKLVVSVETQNKNDAHFVLHWVKNKLPMVVIKGIPTVERAVIPNEDERNKKLNLIVEGTGLREVMGVHGIKACKTDSNHVIEVQQTLGIEAARSCIIKEIKKVMQIHSMDVDTRHMMLLADVMTSKGEVLGVNRYGIAKMKDSVLMLASFEKTDYHLFNGSLNGRKDKIEGVGERIIMGVPTEIGTGIIKVRQRTDTLTTLKSGRALLVS